MARVVEKSAAEEKGMSHRGVEIVLGRLVTDEAARRRFTQAPALALRELMALGLELSPVELAALEALDSSAIQRFAHALDARLQKAELVAQARVPSGDAQAEEA